MQTLAEDLILFTANNDPLGSRSKVIGRTSMWITNVEGCVPDFRFPHVEILGGALLDCSCHNADSLIHRHDRIKYFHGVKQSSNGATARVEVNTQLGLA